METQTDTPIYKTTPGRTPLIVRIILLISITLFLIYYSARPGPFGVFIGILAFFFLIYPSHKIVIYEDYFVFKKITPIILANKSYKFHYKSLEKVVFYPSKVDWHWDVIPIIPKLTGKKLSIIFKYNNKEQDQWNYDKIHLKWKDLQECQKIINKKIQDVRN